MSSNYRYSVLAGAGVFLSVYLVQTVLSQAGVHGAATFLDDALLGTVAGAVLYRFLRRLDAACEEQRLQRCAQVADQLNHHVRNALQVILNRTAMEPHSAAEMRDIGGAVDRIDWALREIIPVDGAPPREVAKHPPEEEKIAV